MITDAQRSLIDAIGEALSADPQIEAAWLAGSLGAGGGDAFSDVDVLVLATGAGEAAQRYAADLSAIAQTVLVNALYGRVVTAVTDDWRRFDLSFVEAPELARYNRARLQPLFNRGDAEPPTSDPAPYRTSPGALAPIVSEFFRILGLSVVGVGREEYVICLSGVELLRRLTLDLMLEENGVGPADRGGALRRNPMLNAEQRAELASLSPVKADRGGIIAANNELAAIFLPRARRLAAEVGLEWPEAFEIATREHLARNLQVTLPGRPTSGSDVAPA